MIRIILSLLLLAGSFTSHAQFNDLLNKAKNKVKQRTDKKIDREMDKTLDRIDPAKKAGAPNASSSSGQDKESGTATAIEGKTENLQADHSVKSYSRFDFIPGEKIIYSDRFEHDEIGELPLNWNTGGKAEVVTLNNLEGNWLRLFQNAVFLTSNTASFTENFTVEFDVVVQLKNNGYTYPSLTFGFIATDDLPANDNIFLNELNKFQSGQIHVRLHGGGQSSIVLETALDRQRHFSSEAQRLPDIEHYFGKISHVAIQVQKSRFRCWINGEKKFDLPMALPVKHMFNQLFFRVSSSSYHDDQVGFYISNLNVATGKPDARHKLVEEGKFSTTGIHFDIASASIKPESAGTLKEVADILTKHPEMRIKIIGHTDSDGAEDKNLELSGKRAESVSYVLKNEYKIAGERLESEGKGETVPVADNKSREGKAQNRRVEFIRL